MNTGTLSYSHTQRAPIGWILAIVGAVLLIVAFAPGWDAPVALTIGVTGGVLVLLPLIFASLTIRDEGDALVLRYGPLPLLHKRFRYADIDDAQPARSSFIDGWGIHYIPGRGWTYNLWGKACVRLDVSGRTVRVGSDDAEHLAEMIQGKLARRG